jgi:hypothetical protein
VGEQIYISGISKNDANLLTREGVFFFISKKLGEIDSEIGNKMLVVLRRHISKRRKKDMVSLMRFLQSSSIPRVDKYDEFCYSNKLAIVSKAKEIMLPSVHSLYIHCSAHTSSQHIFSRILLYCNCEMILSNELQNAIAAVSVRIWIFSKVVTKLKEATIKGIYE